MKNFLFVIFLAAAICTTEAVPFNPPTLSSGGYSKTKNKLSKENIKRIKDCLRYTEFRWAVICEYYGFLSDYYPADRFGGSTGMVRIYGKNCTPYGAGRGDASFIGADRSVYNFNEARHSSCPHASETFHLAQYYLFFTPQGKAALKRYSKEINALRVYNIGN